MELPRVLQRRRSHDRSKHAAGSAMGNDNQQAAIKIFEAFIHRVEGQSGKAIDPWMADLLIEDARAVIESLL